MGPSRTPRLLDDTKRGQVLAEKTGRPNAHHVGLVVTAKESLNAMNLKPDQQRSRESPPKMITSFSEACDFSELLRSQEMGS